jgi:iron-sulfur cluster assembly protein|tara:strand:+ start:113 stop:436 length:324 start_codon:yes stop_codon:yes gene_type:complete
MITVTSKALDQVKRLLDQRGKNSKGIRIGIKTKGCSGLSYNLEYVDEPEKADEKIQIENVNIFIDSKATLFLIGTQMDYVEDDLQAGFEFTNPNEKGKCGCGESFHV